MMAKVARSPPDTHPTHTSVALVHPSPMASIPKRSNHALRLEPASDGDTPAMANATPNGTDRTLAAIRRVRFGTTSVSLSGGIAQVQRDVLHTGGRVLHMNLLPDERPCWRVTRNVDRTVTLHPSIWRNKDCGSHFWLRNGRIRWCQAGFRWLGMGGKGRRWPDEAATSGQGGACDCGRRVMSVRYSGENGHAERVAWGAWSRDGQWVAKRT